MERGRNGDVFGWGGVGQKVEQRWTLVTDPSPDNANPSPLPSLLLSLDVPQQNSCYISVETQWIVVCLAPGRQGISAYHSNGEPVYCCDYAHPQVSLWPAASRFCPPSRLWALSSGQAWLTAVTLEDCSCS